jgi:hypothetical protein
VGAAIEREVNQRRHRHATRCGNDRQQRVAQVGQFAIVQFALQFQADQQKEDGHQRVVDPQLDAQAGQVDLPERQVGRPPGGIGDQQRQDGAQDQDRAARLAGRREFLERVR